MAGTSIMPDYNPNHERPRRIYSVLKALLVIGFTYWLIVASILVYLLVLAQSLESEHLCVWVGCTFVLLVVFGAVLFLGLMVVHYLHDDAINHKQYSEFVPNNSWFETNDLKTRFIYWYINLIAIHVGNCLHN